MIGAYDIQRGTDPEADLRRTVAAILSWSPRHKRS